VPGTSYVGTSAYHEGEELLSFEVWSRSLESPVRMARASRSPRAKLRLGLSGDVLDSSLAVIFVRRRRHLLCRAATGHTSVDLKAPTSK